jgi:hypothetical protein
VANQYASWAGAGRIGSSRLIDTDSSEELDPSDMRFESIRRFLPPAPGSAGTDILVARVATNSRKRASTEVVKLFLSGSWSWGLTRWLESAEFTKVDGDPLQLESDDEIDLPENGWRSVGKVRLVRDADHGYEPQARIYFENDVGESVSVVLSWE